MHPVTQSRNHVYAQARRSNCVPCAGAPLLLQAASSPPAAQQRPQQQQRPGRGSKPLPGTWAATGRGAHKGAATQAPAGGKQARKRVLMRADPAGIEAPQLAVKMPRLKAGQSVSEKAMPARGLMSLNVHKKRA